MLIGPGISVPSGIPDFRTPRTGLWGTSTRWRSPTSPSVGATRNVLDFYGQRFAILDGKQPNGAHRAIAELERRGLVSARGHAEHRRPARRGGLADPIEVHGSIRPPRACVRRVLLAGRDARARRAPAVRRGAVLKPDVVLFGEMLPERAILRATALAASAGC